MRRHKRWIAPHEQSKIGFRRQREECRVNNPVRHEQRMVEGLELEERVEKLLTEMKAEGKILNCTRHPRNSHEDRNGWDFTVLLKDKKISFGITCSFRQLQKYYRNHPGQECLWMAMSQTDDEIKQQLLNFFARIAA